MISLFKEKISVRSDDLQSAIAKKSSNTSLSNKTLDKLESIINAKYNFNNGEAKLIFGSDLCISDVN